MREDGGWRIENERWRMEKIDRNEEGKNKKSREEKGERVDGKKETSGEKQ